MTGRTEETDLREELEVTLRKRMDGGVKEGARFRASRKSVALSLWSPNRSGHDVFVGKGCPEEKVQLGQGGEGREDTRRRRRKDSLTEVPPPFCVFYEDVPLPKTSGVLVTPSAPPRLARKSNKNNKIK